MPVAVKNRCYDFPSIASQKIQAAMRRHIIKCDIDIVNPTMTFRERLN